ncbi:MAG: MSCRAMM family adhesin SdrC [Thermoplasmata archaeon]|nr:MSCRAMM family adhesin SdrC [Thermoplasmata archaeon]
MREDAVNSLPEVLSERFGTSGENYRQLPVLHEIQPPQFSYFNVVSAIAYHYEEVPGDPGRSKWYIDIGYERYNATSVQLTLPFLCLDRCGRPEYTVSGREVHVIRDTDADGTSDLGDSDSDNDGIKDGDEPLYWLDTDNDGRANMRDTDSDNDGLLDPEEDTDTDGKLDAWESSPLAADTDSDALNDSLEWRRYFTNPGAADTDGDGLSDKEEVHEGVWWYRTELRAGEEKDLSGLPTSHYLLGVWANSTGQIKIALNSSSDRHTYTISNAEKGKWYWIRIADGYSPSRINVSAGSIKQFVFVPVEDATIYPVFPRSGLSRAGT